MVKPLSIQVLYNSNTKVVEATRNEFLSKVSKDFKIPEDDIDIYDRLSKKKISVMELKDISKVEVKRRSARSYTKANGQSNDISPAAKDPMIETLRNKLFKNSTLTGVDRKKLIDLLLSQPEPGPSNSLKRKREDPNLDNLTRVKPEMKNVKLQVDPAKLIAVKDAYAQTEIVFEKNSRKTAATSSSELEEKMKKLASLEKIDPVKVAFLMTETYSLRRNFILRECPVVKLIKEKYPLLFSLAEVRNEIDRQFFTGKCENFFANVRKYAKHVISMTREDDNLLPLIREKEQSLNVPEHKSYATEVGSLLLISSIVHEDRHFLQLTDTSPETANLPYIEAEVRLDDIFKNNVTFKVHVENQLLCEATDFPEAIFCLISSYFIFNIQYPDRNFNTLVTLEKIYLEVMDTDVNDIDDSIQQIHKYLRLKGQLNSS